LDFLGTRSNTYQGNGIKGKWNFRLKPGHFHDEEAEQQTWVRQTLLKSLCGSISLLPQVIRVKIDEHRHRRLLVVPLFHARNDMVGDLRNRSRLE
jgi:hypothetical protein